MIYGRLYYSIVVKVFPPFLGMDEKKKVMNFYLV